MLMRTDPFRDLDRITQQVLGTMTRPAVMPLDAWREDDRFIAEFDLPGVDARSIELDVERNVLTVRAERPELDGDREYISAERPRGMFTRRLFLGDALDTDRIEAHYRNGVLRLTIPIADKAKPRKITVIDADHDHALEESQSAIESAAAEPMHEAMKESAGKASEDGQRLATAGR